MKDVGRVLFDDDFAGKLEPDFVGSQLPLDFLPYSTLQDDL